jgi:hypothetical protein
MRRFWFVLGGILFAIACDSPNHNFAPSGADAHSGGRGGENEMDDAQDAGAAGTTMASLGGADGASRACVLDDTHRGKSDDCELQ